MKKKWDRGSAGGGRQSETLASSQKRISEHLENLKSARKENHA
ncbi:hypothetical protein [Bradyrhizobium sp.]|jgi:hypothetical protein|nr:hypothetical protein [Bradyrhizobium sp.]